MLRVSASQSHRDSALKAVAVVVLGGLRPDGGNNNLGTTRSASSSSSYLLPPLQQFLDILWWWWIFSCVGVVLCHTQRRRHSQQTPIQKAWSRFPPLHNSNSSFRRISRSLCSCTCGEKIKLLRNGRKWDFIWCEILASFPSKFHNPYSVPKALIRLTAVLRPDPFRPAGPKLLFTSLNELHLRTCRHFCLESELGVQKLRELVWLFQPIWHLSGSHFRNREMR